MTKLSANCGLTQNTYKINHKLNCHDKCLIYLLICKQCWKQYIGETTDAFRKRWNNYKNNARKFSRESCMQQHLFGHFQSPGHTDFVEDVCITFIDKTEPFTPTKREDYWRQTLKTLAPNGLNIKENV